MQIRCKLLPILAFIMLTVPLVSYAQSPLQFVPITPCRIVDTRYTGGPIQGGTSRNFTIQGDQGQCTNIPGPPAVYSLNVTVLPYQGQPLGYLTIWPAGGNRPVISLMNSYDGRIKANAAIIGAGDGGAVSVYVTNTANVLLDVNGYFIPATSSSLAFYALTPCRVLDTRYGGGGYLHGGQTYAYPIAGLCNMPSSATAYSLNFTAVPHQPLGYLTAWPAGQQQKPVTSILNAPTGTLTANAATIEAGTDGQGNNIQVYVTNDSDLLIDVNGYFAPPSSAPGGLSLFTVSPCRVLDTRYGSGAFSGTLPVNVIGSSCAMNDSLPDLAQALVVNASVFPDGSLGYLTLWANGQQQPVVSTLNAVDGWPTSNMAVVPVSNGFLDAFAKNPTNLLVDLMSYFAVPSGLNGNYTFTIEGYNTPGNPQPSPCQTGSAVGPFVMAGSFVADGNGNITSGVLDLNCFNLPANTAPPTNVSFKGTYSIQANGLGTMTITPTLNLPMQLSVAISSTGNGRLVLNNQASVPMQCCYLPNAWGTGAISVQNPAALQQYPVGNFASGFSGVDPSLNRYAGAGAYQITATQNVTGSAYSNDTQTGVLPLLISGSLLSLNANTGRGTVTLINNGLQTNWVYYVTSANELTLLDVDSLSAKGANLVLQTMLTQATSSFDNTYLNGASVIRTSGLSQSSQHKQQPQGGGAPDVVLGLFTGNGSGNGNVSLDENNGGTLTQQTMNSGQYSVSSNGLVVLTGFGSSSPPLFYLVDKNEAFVLGQDASVASGFLVPQSGSPFSNASATGTYWGGNYMPVTMDVTDSVVYSFADSMGNLTGTINYSGPTGMGSYNFTNTYSIDSTGRMQVFDSSKNLVDILYVISPTKVALLPVQTMGEPEDNPSVSVFGSTP